MPSDCACMQLSAVSFVLPNFHLFRLLKVIFKIVFSSHVAESCRVRITFNDYLCVLGLSKTFMSMERQCLYKPRFGGFKCFNHDSVANI